MTKFKITSQRITRTDGSGIEEREYKRFSDGVAEHYRCGNVRTPHGYVYAYSGKKWVALDFAHNGRWYRATDRREYTRRRLATLAARFARGIVEGSKDAD